MFNGVLTGYERDLNWYGRTNLGGGEAAYCQLLFAGNVMDPRFRRDHPLGPIWIMKRGTQRDPATKIEDYLESLAHEMLHALFVIYACNCKNGCAEKLHDAYYHWRGHCASWQAAAYAIQRASKLHPMLIYSSVRGRSVAGSFWRDVAPVYLGNLALWHLCSVFSAGKSKITNWMIVELDSQARKNGLLGLNLSLHRTSSFAFDIQSGCGASIPAESELNRLGLNLEYIKFYLATQNTEKAVADKKETRKQQLRMANQCLRDWWVADTDVEVVEECGSVDADRDDGDDTA